MTLHNILNFTRRRAKKDAAGDPNPAGPQGSPDPPPEAVGDPVAETIRLHQKEAFQNAIDSVAISPDPARVAALKDDAEGAIRRLYRGPFDPSNPGDADLERRHGEARERVRTAGDDAIRARTARIEAERNVPPQEPPPQVSAPVVVCGITGFGFAFGSCLGELPMLSAIEDDPMRLMIAFGIGLVLGLISVASLFGLKVYDEKASPIWSGKSANPAWPLVAGLVFIAAFTMIRLAVSETLADHLFTFALTFIDIGILMYVKTEAACHRLRDDAWTQRNDNRLKKAHLAAIEKARETEADTAREKARAQLKQIEAELAARLQLDFSLEDIATAGRNAVYQAYLSGIDKNLGRAAAGKVA